MSSRVGTDEREVADLLDKDVLLVLFSETSGSDDGCEDAEKSFE